MEQLSKILAKTQSGFLIAFRTLPLALDYSEWAFKTFKVFDSLKANSGTMKTDCTTFFINLDKDLSFQYRKCLICPNFVCKLKILSEQICFLTTR
jgi:hypothetical protein